MAISCKVLATRDTFLYPSSSSSFSLSSSSSSFSSLMSIGRCHSLVSRFPPTTKYDGISVRRPLSSASFARWPPLSSSPSASSSSSSSSSAAALWHLRRAYRLQAVAMTTVKPRVKTQQNVVVKKTKKSLSPSAQVMTPLTSFVVTFVQLIWIRSPFPVFRKPRHSS